LGDPWRARCVAVDESPHQSLLSTTRYALGVTIDFSRRTGRRISSNVDSAYCNTHGRLEPCHRSHSDLVFWRVFDCGKRDITSHHSTRRIATLAPRSTLVYGERADVLSARHNAGTYTRHVQARPVAIPAHGSFADAVGSAPTPDPTAHAPCAGCFSCSSLKCPPHVQVHRFPRVSCRACHV
jgi:hypothetical protein